MLEGASPLLLVGAGKMGSAMLDRWLSASLDPRHVTVIDPFLNSGNREQLVARGVSVVGSAGEAGNRSYAILILAVKPQVMADALRNVAGLAGPDTAVVSIAAGVRLERLEAAFAPSQPIVRAMPNTPAQVGLGMTVAVANDKVSPAMRGTIDRLLAAVGKVAWIEDEALIDAVTAVSGSGPAYVFLLAECLAEAARRAGLPDELADLLARETVAGAGALLAKSPEPPAQLRKNVTSPAGTTAAALSVLMAPDGLEQLMVRAVDAAKRRSIELG